MHTKGPQLSLQALTDESRLFWEVILLTTFRGI